jgi:FkbM family methyltransferase
MRCDFETTSDRPRFIPEDPPVPKDIPSVTFDIAEAPRAGVVPRFLSWLFATTPRQSRGAMHGTHEELFRMRGELTMLRATLDAVRAEVGRRDITTLEELLRTGNRREIEALIRDRTQTVSLPDGSVLCRALGRFKMFTDAADAGIAPHLLLDGYWQYWVTEFVCRNVARGETAYDIGAIYGYWSLVLADLVGAGGRVVALEANPWLHWLLRRNIHVNGLGGVIKAERLAAAEAAHDAISVPALLVGPANGPFAGAFTTEAGRPHCTTPAKTLAEIEPGSIDFLRIGVTTQVDRVIAGMGGLIERSPRLRIMLDFDAARCADAPGLLATLTQHFPLRFVDGDSRAKPCTAEELLGRRRVTTLYLSRIEPR